MVTGDERHLPLRDKGPVRRFIRDYVDARFSIGEILLPALVLILATSFLNTILPRAAVIGTVVAEVSIGLGGGIGRLVIEYAQAAGGDPAKPWAPIIGAVLVGLVAAGFVALLGLLLKPYRRSEVAA